VQALPIAVSARLDGGDQTVLLVRDHRPTRDLRWIRKTLYVVQNRDNEIAVVRLSGDLTSGR
jgi:hypothetical protein